MKLFIDTSNKKIILATIGTDDKIVDFLIEDTNNDVVKNTIPKIESFLKRTNLKINEIEEFLFTIGPGSFTGVKVPLNIVKSISLLRDIGRVRVIDSFKLIETDKFEGTVIPFGKSKFYYKKTKRNKIKIINKEEYEQLKNISNGYDEFTKDTLQSKLNDRSFKAIEKLDKVEIKYLSAF